MITGGQDASSSPDGALKTVTRYSRTGEAETLSQLNHARRDHACGSYLNDEGDDVRLLLNVNISSTIVMQVLLVTGGINTNQGRLISTEILEVGGTWKLTAGLPTAISSLRAAVLDNNIFVFGETLFYQYQILNILLYKSL